MHVKKLSKPVCASAGFDPAPLVTAKANMVNALVGVLKVFIGVPKAKT